MLLHSHPVNVERQATSRLPINSVWFWGAGKLPQVSEHHVSNWQGIWGNEFLLEALARFTQTEFYPLPVSAHDWLEKAAGGNHLLVSHCFRQALMEQDMFSCLECLRTLETDWVAPLLKSLSKKEINSVSLFTGTKSFFLDGSLARRWWRRSHPLTSFFN